MMEQGGGDEGLVGRVAVSVPHYAAVPPMLCVTDMVATLPRSLALREAELRKIVLLDLPYEPLAVPVEAVWHQRAEQDAGIRWLIGEFTELMA
jgi:DNA-binding transcriptional LysR family regulator